MGWALVAELDLGSLELLQGAGRKEMASGFTLLNRTGFSEEPMWGEGKALKVTSKVPFSLPKSCHSCLPMGLGLPSPMAD
jgi:hypothetical protein